MKLKEFDILLDIKRNKKVEEFEIVQGDYEANILKISLVEDFNEYELSGLNIEIAFAKSDGTTVLQDSSNGISLVGNKIVCTLKTNTIASPGKVLAEVRVVQGDKLLTSSRFSFFVRQSIVNDKTVESTNEFPILNKMIEDVSDLLDEIQSKPEIQGYSAYQIWLNEGNIGTVDDYLASLIGPPGETGPPGPEGPQGERGPTGSITNLDKGNIEEALGYTPIKSINGLTGEDILLELASDIEVVNNLDETVAGKALDATQGKILNDKIASAGKVESVNGKEGVVVIDVPDIVGLSGSKLALGSQASATNKCIALGDSAAATGIAAVALGNNARATGNNTSADSSSIALGNGAKASGFASIALGNGATTTTDGIGSIAIGISAVAGGFLTTAIGNNAKALNMEEGVLGVTPDETGTSDWKVPGSFSVEGLKNFEISHPKESKRYSHVIRHGSVESPSAGDTLYRYKVKSTKENDIQIIELPDYFIHLNKDVQIFVTPQCHFGNGYGNLNRDNEQLEIHCQSPGEYNILVIGTRNDDHQSVQDWDIKGVEREIGESWTGETYVFEVDEITEVEEISRVEEEVM